MGQVGLFLPLAVSRGDNFLRAQEQESRAPTWYLPCRRKNTLRPGVYFSNFDVILRFEEALNCLTGNLS